MASGKVNQYDFGEFLFHLMEAAVCTEFVGKKEFVFDRFSISQIGFVENLWMRQCYTENVEPFEKKYHFRVKIV